MTSEQWQQVKPIVQQALETEPQKRGRFVAEKCGDDAALRNEVGALLATNESIGHFIETPAFVQVMTTLPIEEPAPELTPGQRLGHYEVIRELGRGGMGTVYLAQDNELGRKVALKVLPSGFDDRSAAARRFRQEARVVSALNHPNILTIHEIGHFDPVDFIATELVDGVTLRQRISDGPIGLAEAIEVAVQVTAALAEAHAAGIIHRDIKPENIMIRRDGLGKVLDFGIAKLADTQDAAAGITSLIETNGSLPAGTPKYMSPERLRGQPADAGSDVWSLGIVLYEMLTGHVPLDGAVHDDLNLSNSPPGNSEAAGELHRVISRCLERDAGSRYRSAAELLQDLKGLQQSIRDGIAAAEANSARLTIRGGGPTSAVKLNEWNMAIAVAALVIITALAGMYFYFAGQKATIDSIAVMPFVNVSGDADTEYLSDGITESLINSLSQLPSLKMIARSSVFRYKGKEVNPQAVGRELGVQAVLTGRVVQHGDNLSISVELVDVQNNSHLWGEQYNRKLADLLTTQSEISLEISQKLRLRLAGDDQQRVTKHYTENTEAYQHYLKGRYYWNRRTAEGLKKAIEQFQQAIDRDPNYALGYAGLADSYLVMQQTAGVPTSEVLPKAKAATLRALQIDDSLAEAHASLAWIYTNSWQWEDAEEEFRRAIQLNPNYPTVHQWYSLQLENMGRLDEAMAEIKRAQELDPLSGIIAANLARTYILRGDLDAAIAVCNNFIELDPNFPQTYVILALAYQRQGRDEEAIAEAQKGVELSRRAVEKLGILGYAYAVAGKRSEALAILRELEERHARRESTGARLAHVYAGLGDMDQAFAWLEKDFEDRSGPLAFQITGYPILVTLRSDPRYADLLHRMGLKP